MNGCDVALPVVSRLFRRRAVALSLAFGSLIPATMDAQVSFNAVADSAKLAPPPDARITYGSAPQQFVELRVPAGRGPHPVVMLIHGGCWRAAYDVAHVAGLAEALRQGGFATWTIEYRRVGDEGGGDPGTFDDIRAAFDALITQAKAHGLDRNRVILAGHSAGGHLALWLAAEPGVKARGVVSLAGITDLAAFIAPTGCGSAVPLLLGGTVAERPDAYAARSPVTRAKPSMPVTLIVAEDDKIVPPAQWGMYVARFPGVPEVVIVPGGHFDLVAPWSAAFPALVQRIRTLLPH